MRTILIFLVVSIALAGCDRTQPVVNDNLATGEGGATAKAVSGGGNSVEPMTPGVGPITPVSGSDSVEGEGGGGVGNSLKQKAKNLPGAIDNPPKEGDGTPDVSEN